MRDAGKYAEAVGFALDLCAERERDEFCDQFYMNRRIDRLWTTLREAMGAEAFDEAISQRVENPDVERQAIKAERDAAIDDPAEIRRRMEEGQRLSHEPAPGRVYSWRFADGTPVTDRALGVLECDGSINPCRSLLDGFATLEPRNQAEHATVEGKAKAVLEEIFRRVDEGGAVGFGEDWGPGSITLNVGDNHTHCGMPGGTADDLIAGLYGFLVRGRGLGLAIPLAPPGGDAASAADGTEE